MSEELEDALRRELRAESVPFDESRADDMIRSVTESRLAGAPRAWLAPLAAAAAVVVVGGGIALATSGGSGGNSTAGPERAGGVGSSANTGGSGYSVPECGSIGSGAPSLGVVGTAVPVAGSSVYSVPVPVRTYTAIASATVGQNLPPDQNLPPESASEPDSSPYPPTVSSTAGTSRRAFGPRATAATATPASVASATELPPPTGSDAPVETVPRNDVIVICAVGTASPGSTPGEVCTQSGHEVTCSGSYCTKSGHRMTCVGSGTCTLPPASSSTGRYNAVLCVDPPSVGYATVAPTKWPLSYLPTTPPTVGGSTPIIGSASRSTARRPSR
jgi:hypothetical protein